MYRFDLASRAMDGALGACHAIEVPFVFDNLDRGGVDLLLGGLDDGSRALAATVARAWAAVAHTASPSHDGLHWPAYDLDRRLTCVLDRRPAIEADPDAETRTLWDEIAPAATPPPP
jgi:para-nitrobenzyl esterase